MKRKHILAALVLGIILLTGCSGNLDTVTINTMTIEKDGTIADVSVEDFSNGNYDLSKLEDFINAEVSDYNSEAGEGSIVVDQIVTEGNIVKLRLNYAGIADYNTFNHTEYELTDFASTSVSGMFTSTTDGSSVKPGDMSDPDMKVLKIQDAMNIICRGKVLYYNADITENNGTFTASGEGTAVIIFK